jgi:hypothetical protein
MQNKCKGELTFSQQYKLRLVLVMALFSAFLRNLPPDDEGSRFL